MQYLLVKHNKHDVDLTIMWYCELREWLENHPPVKFDTDGQN